MRLVEVAVKVVVGLATGVLVEPEFQMRNYPASEVLN